MDDKNLQILAGLLESLDNKSTLEEVVKSFEVVIEFVKKSHDLTENEVGNLREMFVQALDEMKSGNREHFEAQKARFMTYCESEIAKIIKISDKKIKEIDQKLSEVKDGEDADEDKIVNEVLSRIPPNKVLNATDIRDELESLKKGEKLSIQAIEDLSEILDELKKKKGGALVGGGGMNAIPMHFIDDETPTGTKNGVNTDFNLNLTPATGSLKVYRNGARQRLTEDYTLSGQTITFINPPESDEIILCDYRV